MNSIKEEQVDTKIEKGKLFFDKELKTFIEFNYEQKVTCQKIYDENRIKIIDTIIKINKDLPEYFDLDMELEEDNYFFCWNKPNSKKDKNKYMPANIQLKINLTEEIYNTLINCDKSQVSLCFFYKNTAKTNLRKNAISYFVLEKDIYENTQETRLRDFTTKDNISNELFRGTVFLYDIKTKNSVKKEIIIDLEKITFVKEIKFLYSSSIEKIRSFYYDSEEYKKYKIKGEKHSGYIMIDTKGNETYLISQKQDKYKKLLSAVKCCMNNYRMSIIDLQIDNDIDSIKSGLFAIYHLIIDNCFLLQEILSNNEKRKIFMSVFPNEKVGKLLELIFDYKSINRTEKYIESWTFFKQILKYLEPYKDKDKEKKDELYDIIKNIDISKYTEILNKTNDVLQKSLFNNQKNNSDNNNDLNNNMNDGLKEYLKDDLFDDLFFSSYDTYIYPFFDKIRKCLKEGETPQNKSEIRKKFQLLLAFYYFKFNELQFNRLGKKLNNNRTTSSLMYQKKLSSNI